MNVQEAYNGIFEHFSQPGIELSRAKPEHHGSRGSCFYRYDNTPECPRRCAVGALLPDELYDPKLDDFLLAEEGTGVATLFEQHEAIYNWFTQGLEAADADKLYEFLVDAQGAHDTADDVPHFLRELNRTAMHYNLSIHALPSA